ncbi:MAG: hypothetical protein DMF78_20545 [Acidobacteria bacterium]|nr:MAG: hypothetical protein DMF78_20545 [Acidobacteriota bacterium]
MSKRSLIRRYEHNYFSGWVVATKRRGKKWTRYFSDKPDGVDAALRRARQWRAQLLAALPPVTKVKRTYVLNTTGVIGVARVRETTRSGRIFSRYVAQWPRRDGSRGKATFSIVRYGERNARRLAIQARGSGLAELGIIDDRELPANKQMQRTRPAQAMAPRR